MLTVRLTFILLLITQFGFSQVISQFTWDKEPVTKALIGPDAIGYGASTRSYPGGVGGTNGLNANPPGFTKLDLDFKIKGTSLFDVAGIDVSIDYQSDESTANFFDRGNSLIITAGTSLSVSYRVKNGSGSFNTVSSGGVYTIPSDDIFRTYRFYYLPSIGLGVLSVNGVVVWSNDGPNDRDMYWTSAGDIIIGKLMDGNGNNKTNLDNLIIGSVIETALPISLLNFNVDLITDFARLKWTTASELNNDKYRIEKSVDYKDWTSIGEVQGAGNSSQKLTYFYDDLSPYYGKSFYRIIQLDFDGKETVYGPISLLNNQSNIVLYPNPANSFIEIQGIEFENQAITIHTADGIKIVDEVLNTNKIAVHGFPNGTYFLTINNETISFIVVD